jgi:hypothetical protein
MLSTKETISCRCDGCKTEVEVTCGQEHVLRNAGWIRLLREWYCPRHALQALADGVSYLESRLDHLGGMISQ